MEIAGSLKENLDAAVRSAQRLSGQPVHKDTLSYWQELLSLSRATKRWEPVEDMMKLEELMAALHEEITSREAQYRDL